MDLGFLWDEEKEEAVQKKHNVNLEQAVEALVDPHHLYEEDPQQNWGSSWSWEKHEKKEFCK